MKKLAALAVLSAMSVTASAEPFLVSNPSDNPGVTHCALYFDSEIVSSERTPVAIDENGAHYCKFDLGGLTPGSYTVRASYQIDYNGWGIDESPLSDPFSFERPAFGALTIAPVLRISPY